MAEHDDASAGLTSSGQVLGTPDYMAPEQWDDTHTVDRRADLYSLGCTLFFVLTGKAPFASDKPRSMLHIMKAHVDGAIPDLTERCPQAPAELNALFQRLLAKKLADRFATAAEVAAALEPFIHKHDARATGSSSAERRRHAPRDEPNDPSTPNSEPTLPETQSLARSTADQSSTSTPRSAHHAERDGDVDSPGSQTTSIIVPRTSSRSTSTTRQRVASLFTTRQRVIFASILACVVIAGIVIAITQRDGANARRMAAPGRPSDTLPNTKKTAEGGHPPKEGWHGWPVDAPPPAIAPFDAEQAQHHQEAWAKYLGVPVEYTNSLGMKFRLIPPGEFTMGSSAAEIEAALKDVSSDDKHWQECIKSEAPQHKVILTQPI